MRRFVLAVVAISALTGCGAAHHPAAKVPATTSPTPSPSPTTTPPPAPTAPASTPLGAGERVWAAFSASTLPYNTWWARLKPLLSDAASAVYVYDDPHNLPSMSLTGPIRVAAKAPAEPRYTAEVIVPTTKGTFALDLERATLTSPWLLYAIKFPPGVQ